MAIVKAVSSRASIGRAIIYVTQTEKTDERLISGIDCSPDTAIEEMKTTKAVWKKEGGRQYQHFIHSFPPGENVTLKQAHEMAKELCAGRFMGHEVVIATHKDTKHIHSHIIVNSVNYDDGYKLHWKKQDLQRMKDKANEMSKERGLSVPVKGNEITVYPKNKYKALERAIESGGEYKSYVLDCYKAVSFASRSAIGQDDFIDKMKTAGYETNWTDKHKHITFTDQNGNKVRAANLEKTFKEPVGKENLLNGFERNLNNANARTASASNKQHRSGHRDITVNSITKLRATINQSKTIARNGDRSTANHRVGCKAGNNQSNDTVATIAKLRNTVGKPKIAIPDGERRRTDSIINNQSRQREPDRTREPEAQRRDREFPERSR